MIQPVTLAPPDQATPTRRLNARLRDMRDFLGSFIPNLVQNGDGTLQLTMGTLNPQEVTSDPYPYLDPQTRLATRGTDPSLASQNKRLLSEMEDTLNGYGTADFTSVASADNPNVVLSRGRANPAGYSPVYGFQVVWSGTRHEWAVLEGNVIWHELDTRTGDVVDQQQTVKTKWLGVAAPGFAVLPLRFSPATYDPSTHPVSPVEGYTVQVGFPTFTGQPTLIPPTVSFTALDDGSGSFIRRWTQGYYEMPLAKLTPPGVNGRRTPLIEPIAAGDLNFPDARWLGSLPQPTPRAYP